MGVVGNGFYFPPPDLNFNVGLGRVDTAGVWTRLPNIDIGGMGGTAWGGKIKSAYGTPAPLVSLWNPPDTNHHSPKTPTSTPS
mgnify:CR=1 FL=1